MHYSMAMASTIQILFFLASAFVLGHAQSTITPSISNVSSAVDNSTAMPATETNTIQTTATLSAGTTSATVTADQTSVAMTPSTTSTVSATDQTSVIITPSTTSTVSATYQTSVTITPSTTSTISTTGQTSVTTTPSTTNTVTATGQISTTTGTSATDTMTSTPSLTSNISSTASVMYVTPSLQSSYTSSTGAAISSTATTPLPGSSSATQAPMTTDASMTSSSVQPTATSDMPSPTASDSTTTAPTTTTTATTSPAIEYQPFNQDSALFILSLNLSTNPNLTADINYNNDNITELKSKLSQALSSAMWTYDLQQKTDSLRLYSAVSALSSSSMYSLVLKFIYSDQNSSVIESLVQNALKGLNESDGFTVQDSAVMATSNFFKNTFSDPCMAMNICPLSFECVKGKGCKHSCAENTCSGNGQCIVDVMPDKNYATKCICNESYDTEYYGDKCENSRTGKLQIIAIISGVLGATILVLFIALLVVCCSSRRKESGYNFSPKKYENSAYDPVDK